MRQAISKSAAEPIVAASAIPMTEAEREARIVALLHSLGIAFERTEHAPILTTREGAQIAARTGALCMKNLLLASRRGLWRLLMPAQKRFSSKPLAARIGSGRLSFASDADLRELLGTYRGAGIPL